MSELEANSFPLGLRPSSVRGPILARIPARRANNGPTVSRKYYQSWAKVRDEKRASDSAVPCCDTTWPSGGGEGNVVDFIATILSLFLIASLIVWLTEKLLGKSIMHERWKWWIKGAS
jgi:hypothetical protein